MKKETSISVIQKQITDDVLTKIKTYQQGGLIRLPKDYSPENALKAAGIILLETENKDGVPVLKSCTPESVAMALLKMVTEGLSPMKKHGSFIAYGNKLSWQREYDGDVALAIRGGLKVIKSRVVYENDEFEFEVDTETGRQLVTKHKTSLSNINISKILGAYAVYEMEDGSRDTEIMTIDQIKTSWGMGGSKGNSKAHNNFTDTMCKRTVERRAVKPIIRRSNDSHLFGEDEDERDFAVEASREEIAENANKEEIGFDEAEEVEDNPIDSGPAEASEPKKEQKKPESEPEADSKSKQDKVYDMVQEENHVIHKSPGF